MNGTACCSQEKDYCPIHYKIYKMITQQEIIRFSKTISYALRHHPESFGLELDSDGSVPVIRAHDAWKDSIRFYQGNKDIYLSAPIPPEYIDVDIMSVNPDKWK